METQWLGRKRWTAAWAFWILAKNKFKSCSEQMRKHQQMSIWFLKARVCCFLWQLEEKFCHLAIYLTFKIFEHFPQNRLSKFSPIFKQALKPFALEMKCILKIMTTKMNNMDRCLSLLGQLEILRNLPSCSLLKRGFSAALIPQLFRNNIPGHTTRAPPACKRILL